MKKKNLNVTRRKRISLFAAAALTAVMLGGQVCPAFAGGSGTVIEASTLIPDNVTIEEPTELSNVSLPQSEYGSLSWADGSFVPSQRVQSCEVVFKSSGAADLSGISGFDSGSGTLTACVTVVVSSISGDEDVKQDDDYENSGDSEDTEENEDTEDSKNENPEVSQAPEEGETPEATVTPGITGAPEVTETPEEGETPEATVTPGITGAPEVTEAPEEGETPEATVTPGITGVPEVTETPEEGETPEATVTPGITGAPEVTKTPEEDKDNIFDRGDIKDTPDERPATAEDNLTEEEMAQHAEENHSCGGIYVSGIALPWYVQFRVSGGETYEFTNETDASIFKSYEFQLWDLKNNAEYSIPDGEYISVTVPVKAGYDYSIEHLLSDGAMETIIPSVDGGTMVFSTHSFSPFGIAGSKPIIGSDIAEDGYETTVTPGVTRAPAATATPAASNVSSGSTAPADDSDYTGDSDEGDSGRSAKTVNTGDTTNIYPFVIFAAVAVIAVFVVLYLKRKKK